LVTPGAPALKASQPSHSAQASPAAADSELRIARLKGQVAALEAALERRSYELQVLQRLLCPRDLAQWARVSAGLTPLPQIAHQPAYWHETRDLTVADVEETLEALWSSLHPELAGAADPAGPSRPLAR
jgi:hypothetical protein